MSFIPRLLLGSVSAAGALLLAWAAWVYRPPDGLPALPLLVMSAFCLVITLACFHARSRPITLRVIGGTVLALTVAIIVIGIVKGELEALLSGGAWLAATGRAWWWFLRYGGRPPVPPVEEEFDSGDEWEEAEEEEYSEDEEYEEW